MGEHWPLVVASGLIALAAALGLWQHDRAVELTAQVQTPIRTVSEPAPVAPATAEKPEAIQTPPPLPTANRATFAPAPTPAPVTEPALVPAPAPVAVAPVAPVPTAPAAVQPTAPTAPAVLPAPAQPVRQGRNATLAALRADLQAQMNMAPMDTAGGGYAVAVDGARLEVKSPPNWNITIYNVNPKTPEIETDKFKELLAATVKSLQIDMTPKPIESANGKLYLKTTSKLGSISLIRDPANGNSCTIGPIQQWVTPQQPPATKTQLTAPVNPANPVVPQAQAPAVAPDAQAPVAPAPQPPKVKTPKVPAAPPHPPATDANF